MKKDKFKMPRTVADAIWGLCNKKARVRMINAICDYALDGTTPTLTGDELALFEKLKAEIDAINGGQAK